MDSSSVVVYVTKRYKICKACGKNVLRAGGFHRDARYIDGLRQQCKECLIPYSTARRKTNTQFRLACNLRGRLGDRINGQAKAGSAVQDLGCTVEELKSELESQFSPGMTWENYGCREDSWNIDHIMPLSAFDLTDRQHVLLACHHSNLRPMWHLDNMAKGNRAA